MTAENTQNVCPTTNGTLIVIRNEWGGESRPSSVLPHRAPARRPSPRNRDLAVVRIQPAHEARPAAEPAPIWFAALLASRCQASANGAGHVVNWNCVSGRALYTNAGSEAEVIEPLGVRLESGHTLSVSWLPGETAYTLEVFRQFDYCA